MKKTIIMLLAVAGAFSAFADKEVFKDDFSSSEAGAKLPAGHSMFFASKLPKEDQAKVDYKMAVVESENGKEVVMEDNCPQSGIGITKTIPGTADKTYRLRVKARPVDDKPLKDFVIQIRSMPSNKIKQVQIATPKEGEKYSETTAEIKLQSDDSKVMYYVYSMYPGNQAAAVKEIVIEEVE